MILIKERRSLKLISPIIIDFKSTFILWEKIQNQMFHLLPLLGTSSVVL